MGVWEKWAWVCFCLSPSPPPPPFIHTVAGTTSITLTAATRSMMPTIHAPPAIAGRTAAPRCTRGATWGGRPAAARAAPAATTPAAFHTATAGWGTGGSPRAAAATRATLMTAA